MNDRRPRSDEENDFSVELVQAEAQTLYPPAPPQSRDTFSTWEEVIGNTEAKRTLKAFVAKPNVTQNHILIYGANRSGKSCMSHLALQARFCRRRDKGLNPCQSCLSCQRWLSGAAYRNGRYFDGESSFEYQGVNCTQSSSFDEGFLNTRDWDCPLILFLDEVASPAFSRVIPRLLKPMMELPITIIACCVRLARIREKKTSKGMNPRESQGLIKDFRYRFSNIEKTTTVQAEEFVAWLAQQCDRRGVRVDHPATLEMIHQRSRGVPGQALRPLQRAEFRKEVLTGEFVEGFRWDAE